MPLPGLTFRRAREADLPTLVGLLSDDILGAGREAADRDFAAYQTAFAEIEADANQFLCVVEDGGQIVGMLQLSFIPGLSRGGSKRGQIESARVARHRRDEGIGRAMFDWAILQCRQRGCALVQLTTDKTRPDAHRFYDRLGFDATHVGYKLLLK